MAVRLDRRQLLAGALAFASTGPLQAFAAETGAADARLIALMDTLWNETLQASPQGATGLGLDVGALAGQRGRLDDHSSAGRAAWVEHKRSALARLQKVDRDALSAERKIDLDVAVYQYERLARLGGRYSFGETPPGWYCPVSPYVISQLTGAYSLVPDFLDSQHPVKTGPDAEAYLSRLAQFATALDANTASLRADSARGILAPDFGLDAAVAQMDKLREPAPAENGLATSLYRRAAEAGIAGDWGRRAAAIVEKEVYPALDRQRALVRELRAAAGPDAGIWKIPDGEAYYADCLAFHTTTRLTPEEVHRIGLDQVAEITGRLNPLLKAQGLTAGSVGERLTALGKRPDQLYPNTEAGREALLKSLNDQTEALRARMPQVFRTIPKAAIEVVRVPPAIEDGAPLGYAQGPTVDGSRPGRFYINLKDTAEWPKFSLPTLTYHEALPGHGWQAALLVGTTQIPKLRALGMGFSAYEEGWALYSEQLADEMGAYEGDPFGHIGYLQSLMFRAVRLVVDTGMHAKRWTRQQATDYFVQATGYARGRVQREVDRYCMWPGQACAYKVGHNEFVRIRAALKARRGVAFDLKDFHEVLLKGSMPLVVLERTVLGA